MRKFLQNQSDSNKRQLRIVMVDNFYAVLTGLTLTVKISKAGSTSYSAVDVSGSSVELTDGGNTGSYVITLAAADLDTLGEAMLKITATGARTQFVPIKILESDIEVIDETLTRLLGLSKENMFIDQCVYSSGNRTSSRLRVCTDATGVTTLATYRTTTAYDSQNRVTSFKCVRE